MKTRLGILSLIMCVLLVRGSGAQDLNDPWDKLLQSHVSNGEVDYEAIRKSPDQLNAVLAMFARADPASMSTNDQLAFWINAYNVFTVKLIVDNMPLKSIRDIKSPWKQENWRVGNRILSLDQIEHEILRKDFKEPRIHFAIVCASIGCPDLQNRAFAGATLEEQLARATREFMASPKHIRTELQGGRFGRKKPVLHVSRIFKWFPDDFTDGGKRSIPDFVRLYAPQETLQFISDAGKRLRVEHLDYDWNLNSPR